MKYQKMTKTNGQGNPSLELHLSRSTFISGRHLSGVVVFRLSKPTNIRSLILSVCGQETPSGASLARKLSHSGSFFDREVLLSGSSEPRFTSERLSLLWNSFLERDTGRTLSAGEHTYPFLVPLPASLPSSYRGKAGTISYTVTAAVRFPVRGILKVASEVPVVFAPRAQRGRPVALSYPNTDGTLQGSEVSVNLELLHRTVALGKQVTGKFIINNPQQAQIENLIVSLENCEWVRLESQRELQRQNMDSSTITPDDPKSSIIEGDFKLNVPDDASPTVEGTAISVIWLLKLYINSSPPLELKTPITVFSQVPDA